MPRSSKHLLLFPPILQHQLYSHKERRSGGEPRSSQTECERREGRLGDRGLERDDGLMLLFFSSFFFEFSMSFFREARLNFDACR